MRQGLTVPDIANILLDGNKVVLLGEYGTGKSRCIRELFRYLTKQSSKFQTYPIAVDLREAWGLKRGNELIRRHLEDLGRDELQAAALRALRSEALIFLFDGFDELGSQAWSNDADKLRQIRAKSLEGVKDLINRSSGGALIAGREHYFNSNEEMFSALGIDPKRSYLIRCKTEFSDKETAEFFQRLEAEINIPDWLPRRPLICQTIAELDADDLDRMFGPGQEEVEFWDHFVRILCERDARIHVSFDAKAIEQILVYLSRLTRSRPANVGPIAIADIQAAFEAVIGQAPVEDASVMLQRLPALGRVRAESNERQFIDSYILDGLRAKDVSSIVNADETVKKSVSSASYTNPIDDLGQRILASKMNGRHPDYVQFARRCIKQNNIVLACDIIASVLRIPMGDYDFGGVAINDGNFLRFDMSATLPSNISIVNSVFGSIVLPSAPPPQTTIHNSLAERVYGVSSQSALPDWVTALSSDSYDSVESVSRIRQIGLNPKHEILVAFIRKNFFQKGTGRKEEALLRGLGRIASSSESEKILNILLKDQILSRFRGDEGWVYKPERQHAGRMKKMLYELRTSTDPLWIKVSEL